MSPIMDLQTYRERRAIMDPADLLRRCQDAARLEMRGANYSPEDRGDCAGELVTWTLGQTYGTPPRADDRRYSLTVLCGRAKNLRRALDSQRERDSADAERSAMADAMSPAALGVTGARPTEYVLAAAAQSADAAGRAASFACRALKLDPGARDKRSPVWTVFYVWARDASPEVCAAECSVTWSAWRQRQSRGATLIRATYGAADLLAALIGTPSVAGRDMPRSGIEAGTYLLPAGDGSRAAHGRTAILAAAPRDWQPVEYVVTTRRVTVASGARLSKRDSERARRAADKRGGGREQVEAAALRRIAAEYARGARRERAVHYSPAA